MSVGLRIYKCHFEDLPPETQDRLEEIVAFEMLMRELSPS